MEPIVEMIGITKQFGPLLANNKVNFTLFPGETHAIIGENGSGKTTLMNILFGKLKPEEGEIRIDGKPESYNISQALMFGIGMVHQNFMHANELSVLENIILSNVPKKNGLIDYKSARKKCQELIERFGLRCDLDEIIGQLSVGERQKIEIIKTLYLGARILILDEPTSVLTPQETSELFSTINDLKKAGKSIIFISHKLREVMEVADRVTVLRKGQVTGIFQRSSVQETDLARAMIGKQNVDLLQNLSKKQFNKAIISVENLWFTTTQGVVKIQDLNFELSEGEILGVGGVEGNGQKELQELLIGLLSPSLGKIYYDGIDISKFNVNERRNLGIVLIPEDRMTMGLSVNQSLKDNLLATHETDPAYQTRGVIKRRSVEMMTRKAISDFDIRGANPDDETRKLSGGNLQKLILARELSREPRLIIASQPTRGLDIGAINTVREILLEARNRGSSILLISADLEELMSLSDRVIILFEGSISGEIGQEEIRNQLVSEEEIGLMMGTQKPLEQT